MFDAPREDLRLALVMNGGVSLAVWMGGVTQEIFLLTRAGSTASSEVYRQLLDLTHASASVDVISGTSAGGVNGAALAVALIHDGDFSQLREVWLRTASLQDLLRPPLGDNPGSLLQGDEHFLPAIERALKDLQGDRPARKTSELPIDLRLTTTLLTGQQGHMTDDLGTPLSDVDYRAQFQFLHTEAQDFHADPHWLQAMARAARSTASFPFAFEPSIVDAATSDLYLRTPLGDKVKPGDRHVIDGGILDNKPFHGALQGIFGMPRTGPTRRVLAYVNPDPGNGPEGQTGISMPSLGKVLTEALIGIPQSQTVADQLHEITAHNDKVRRQRDSLLQVASALDTQALVELVPKLFPVYRHRRLSNTYGLLIEPRLQKALPYIGRRTLNQLKEMFSSSELHTGWLPEDWSDDVSVTVGATGVWQWGLFPIEFAASVLLNTLKLAESLNGVPTPHGPGQPSGIASNGDALKSMWPRVQKVAVHVRGRRASEQDQWEAYQADLKAAGHADHEAAKAGKAPTLEKLSEAMNGRLGFLSASERRGWCLAQIKVITQLLQELCPIASDIAKSAEQQTIRYPQEARQAKGLVKLCTLLSAGTDAPWQQLAYRLLQLEVVCYAFDDHETMDQDTLIELVQISGNLSSPLLESTPDPRRAKLRGLELAHFGAFYKKSWRANDWIHGRLDGADRLVNLLLNPERLRRLYAGQGSQVARQIEILALSPADPQDQAALKLMWDQQHCHEAVRRELAFLDHAESPVPDELRHCADAIIRRLHLQTLREELPILATAIADDNNQGAEPGDNASQIQAPVGKSGPKFVPVDATRAIQTVRRGLINDEGLLQQAGTDLFTRTLAHVSASLQNTLASAAAQLGPVSLFFALLKLPIQGFNLVVQGLTRQSHTAAAVHGGMLAAGLVMVFASLWPHLGATAEGVAAAAKAASAAASGAAGGAGLPTGLSKFGWLLLIWGTLFSVMRTPRTAAALLIIGSLIAAVVWGHWAALAGVALGLLALYGLCSVPLIQWALGMGLIAASASYASGDPIWSRLAHWWPLQELEWMGLALIAVLAMAAWQSSRVGAWTERQARALIDQDGQRRVPAKAPSGTEASTLQERL